MSKDITNLSTGINRPVYARRTPSLVSNDYWKE